MYSYTCTLHGYGIRVRVYRVYGYQAYYNSTVYLYTVVSVRNVIIIRGRSQLSSRSTSNLMQQCSYLSSMNNDDAFTAIFTSVTATPRFSSH